MSPCKFACNWGGGLARRLICKWVPPCKYPLATWGWGLSPKGARLKASRPAKLNLGMGLQIWGRELTPKPLQVSLHHPFKRHPPDSFLSASKQHQNRSVSRLFSVEGKAFRKSTSAASKLPSWAGLTECSWHIINSSMASSMPKTY